MDVNLLCYFLLKIYKYEPELFYQIRDLVGLPRLNIGDQFKFKNNLCSNVYQVISIKSMKPDLILPYGKKQMVYYKYGYSNPNLFRFMIVSYIYDYLLDMGNIILVKQPWELEYSDKDCNPEA
jgi:hypothetical protein